MQDETCGGKVIPASVRATAVYGAIGYTEKNYFPVRLNCSCFGIAAGYVERCNKYTVRVENCIERTVRVIANDSKSAKFALTNYDNVSMRLDCCSQSRV